MKHRSKLDNSCFSGSGHQRFEKSRCVFALHVFYASGQANQILPSISRLRTITSIPPADDYRCVSAEPTFDAFPFCLRLCSPGTRPESLASSFSSLGLILNAAVWLPTLKRDFLWSLSCRRSCSGSPLTVRWGPDTALNTPLDEAFQYLSKPFFVLDIPLPTGLLIHLSIYSSIYSLKK